MSEAESPAQKSLPLVFLCYARGDNEAVAQGRGWRDRLLVHLGPSQKQGLFSVFFDECTQTGDEWHKRIQEKVGACDIAVLMISARFLDSDYIREKEIPSLLRRHDASDVRLIPLFLSPCGWDDVFFQYTDREGQRREKMLSELQGVLPADKPLSRLDDGAQEEALTKVAKEIRRHARDIADRRVRAAVSPVREERHTAPASTLTVSPPPKLQSSTLAPGRTDRFTNTLGMDFLPVPGLGVLFSVWETRVQDFDAFVTATEHDATGGMDSFGSEGWKYYCGYTWKNPGFFQTGLHPVVGVNWEDAQAFCRWLSQKENRTYRLPTDLEWSVAVGLPPETGTTPKERDGRIKGVYLWGTGFPPPSDSGNYAGSELRDPELRDANWPPGWPTIEGFRDGYVRTAPVGSFKTNQFGLHDMGGNVSEWCEDKYQPDKDGYVVRGCSWCCFDPRDLLSSSRIGGYPRARNDRYGFRVVLVVESR